MTPPISVDSLDDPRLAPYRNLKDRDVARGGRRFIAEGEQLVRRLLASDYAVESVLLAKRRAGEIAPIVRDDVPIYVASDELMQDVLGFKFHSGVIACGLRKAKRTLDQALGDLPRRATLMICPEIANTENLGGLIRIAAAFGVDAMILGPRCCDPFYRQSVRVSMGAVFSLNLIQSNDLNEDLKRLRDKWGVELIATVLDQSAESISKAARGDRIALLFGNEAQGLSKDVVDLCDRKVTIPMQLGTDSLNVAISAAVFMYHFAKAI